MKLKSNPYHVVVAVLVSLAIGAQAADFTWNGTNNTWNSLNWNAGAGLVGGPTGASSANTATINGGTVTFTGHDTFGNAGTASSPVITINSGATLVNGGWFTTMWNLSLNGGTLLANGGANASFPALQLAGTVTTGGSAVSTIDATTAVNTFNQINIGGSGNTTLIFNVANATGDANPDLIVNAKLQNSTIGAGTLAKSGAGTLSLTAANTYTGGTAINAGILSIGNAAALGTTGAISFGGGTLQHNGITTDLSSRFSTAASQAYNVDTNGQNVTWASGLTSSGGTLAKSGAGTLLLTAANTYSGATSVNGGTLEVSGSGNFGTSALISVASGGTLKFSRHDTFGNHVTAVTQTITVNGGTITNGNNFTTLGAVTLNGGTINSTGGVNAGFPSFSLRGPITVGGSSASTISGSGGNSQMVVGQNSAGSQTTFDVANATGDSAADLTVSVPLQNNRSAGFAEVATGIIKTGAGTMVLSGANTYTGNTHVNGGTLVVDGGTIAGPGLIDIGANAATPANFTLNSGSVTVGSQFVIGAHGSTGTATINSGTLQVNAPMYIGGYGEGTGTGTFTQNGGTVNTAYLDFGGGGPNHGVYNLNGGTLTTSAINKNGSGTTTFNFNGGTLRTSAATTTFLQGHSAANVQSGGAIIDTNGFNITIAQPLLDGGGSGGLTKNGAGTLTLSGNSAYAGTTTISTGTVEVTANNALGSSAGGTSVASGATLKLNNVNYATAEPLSINGSAALQNTGNSTYAGPITAATHATINAGVGSTLTTTGGLVKNGTTLTIAGGGTVIVNGTGISGSAANSDLVVDGTTLVVNAASNYNGPTTVQNNGVLVANAEIDTTTVTVNSGSKLSGTGRVDSAANNFIYINGTLQVGDSTLGSPVASQLEIATSGSGSTVTGAGSSFLFDLFANAGNNNANAAAADRIRLFGTLDSSMGGTLVIGNPNALTGFAVLNSWTLFDLTGGGSISHSLALDYSALNLSSGLAGSFDRTTGIFSVVPEPSRALLLMLGLTGLFTRRRR